MVDDMVEIELLLFKTFGFRIVNVTQEKDCHEYLGHNFQLGNQHVKFRKAKLTPKKIGQFVTLWKRDLNGQTVPYGMDDDFDFHIIMTKNAHQSGCFIFPKEILARMGILTTYDREGKRGFRVYPEWDFPLSSQGMSSKKWQLEYFIDLNDEEKTRGKLKRIIVRA